MRCSIGVFRVSIGAVTGDLGVIEHAVGHL